ncbi:unnamed protein product [Effrenium voratum]|nr:unnamed protein product [Effrenium voratum]
MRNQEYFGWKWARWTEIGRVDCQAQPKRRLAGGLPDLKRLNTVDNACGIIPGPSFTLPPVHGMAGHYALELCLSAFQVDLPLVPGTFCGCRRHYCRQVALRVKLAGERPDRIFGGDQDEMGSVTFRSEQALEVDLDGSRKLRFEVLDEDQQVLAFAEIEAKDLARKARWRLLLSDPSTSEAVYGTSTPASVSTDREAPPAVRRPSFLLLRTEESGPRARASTEADAVPRAREGPSPRRLSVASASAATSKSHSDIVKDRSASVSSVPSSSGRPKVMLITRGTRGDIQPFVALARGLILEQNCDVVFVTELPWKKFVKAATEDLPRGRLRFRPCGGDTSRRVSGDLARYVLSLGQQSVALQALVFSRSEVEFFPSEGCFFHWAWEERPTFIVFGFLLIHVAMIISEALQIPIVGFILQPLREIEPSIERQRHLKSQGHLRILRQPFGSRPTKKGPLGVAMALRTLAAVLLGGSAKEIKVINQCQETLWLGARNLPLEEGQVEMKPNAQVSIEVESLDSGSLWARTGCSEQRVFEDCYKGLSLNPPCAAGSHFYCRDGTHGVQGLTGECQATTEGPFDAELCFDQCVITKEEVPDKDPKPVRTPEGHLSVGTKFHCATGDCAKPRGADAGSKFLCGAEERSCAQPPPW